MLKWILGPVGLVEIILLYAGTAVACILAAPGGGSFPCTPVSFNPANPAASGYVKVLSDDFRVVGTSTINQSTAPTGGSWHWSTHLFFGGDIVAGELTTDANGIIITPSRANFGEFMGTAAPAGNALGWVGTVFGGGAYFEATFSFDGPSVNTAVSWPAFWSMAVNHMASPHTDQWPGQAAGYEHYIEDDFFEYDTASFGPAGSWGSAIHDWQFPPGGPLSGYFNNGSGTTYNNFIQTRPGPTVVWNVATFHTLGHIWVAGDATNSQQGYVQTYLDGVATVSGAQSSKVGWTDGGITTPAALPNSNAMFSIEDQDKLVVQFASGQSQPFHVQQVNIWMIPGCGAVTTN